MRRTELLMILSIGALVGGAYFTLRMMADFGVSRVFHDTYYVQAYQAYVLRLAALALGGLLAYALMVRPVGGWLPTVTGWTFIAFCSAVGALIFTKHIAARQGMPRRFLEADEVIWMSALENLFITLSGLAVVCFCGFCLYALFLRLRRRFAD